MIVKLETVLPNADIAGIPTVEQILAGHQAKAKVGINDNSKPFAYNFFRHTDYLIEAAERLENQIVVDLGAGRRIDGYILSELFGVKAYIGVEAAHMKRLYEKITSEKYLAKDNELNGMLVSMRDFIGTISEYDPEIVKKIRGRTNVHLEKGAGRTPAVLIAEDMLTALKRLPPDSVSVLACGIDRCIHPENDYSNEVEKEITRVLSPSGSYVGACSRFNPSGLFNITKITEDPTFCRYAKQK